MQVRDRRAAAPAAPRRALVVADPLLPRAVEIVVARDADRLAGGEERVSERMPILDVRYRERAARALASPVSSEVGRVVEQTFGVDTFQITPSIIDPNTQSSRLDLAARVTIGKRISDRVYLTYSRSLSSSTRDQIILLEYDQSDRYSWLLSRNEDKTYAIELRVRRTF